MVNHLEFMSGESPTHGLHYWEPVVDGRLLREILDASTDDPAGAVGDNVPVLVHSWPVGLPTDVFVLLGALPPELADRIPIFICPACGDLGCGAITAQVEWTAETVTWRNFGWDVNDVIDEDDDDLRLPAPELVFDRREYEAELRRFIATFDEVRDALPPRLQPSARADAARATRRRRWWPLG